MRSVALTILSATLLLGGCKSAIERQLEKEYPLAVTVQLVNPLDAARPDEAVAVPLALVESRAAAFNPRAMVLLAEGREIPAQLDDADGDGRPDQIIAVIDLAPRARIPLTLRCAETGVKERVYNQRTQAELSVKFGGTWENRKYLGGTFHNVDRLRVPPEHTDHSEFIRYEGPGWESERVGYRFYLDWRNAIDIYGKKRPGMILQQVGQDGFSSYHQMADWGMDILKVGEALGIGSIARWDGQQAQRVAITDSILCRIAASGPLLARIRTDYWGWEVGAETIDLHSELSISAGSRLTRHDLKITGAADNLCTGLVNLPDTRTIPPPASGRYSWLATWGVQSLNNDQLGMAILFEREALITATQDSQSHVVVLRPESNRLHYYFLAAWEGEPGGITSEQAFATELAAVAARLNNPVMIQ